MSEQQQQQQQIDEDESRLTFEPSISIYSIFERGSMWYLPPPSSLFLLSAPPPPPPLFIQSIWEAADSIGEFPNHHLLDLEDVHVDMQRHPINKDNHMEKWWENRGGEYEYNFKTAVQFLSQELFSTKKVLERHKLKLIENSVNKVEPFTQRSCSEFCPFFLIFIRDLPDENKDILTYAFDIFSIADLIFNDGDNSKNPFTRKTFTKAQINKMNCHITLLSDTLKLRNQQPCE